MKPHHRQPNTEAGPARAHAPKKASPPAASVAGILARPRLVDQRHVVPLPWRGDLRQVLLTEVQLKRRVAELARALSHDYVGRDPVVVALLTGTLMFLADLLRRLVLPLKLDFIGVSSYRTGTTARDLVFTKELHLDVAGRDVLVVDDILDTGRTLKAVCNRLARLKPASLRTCVLLDKPARRTESIEADYVGFVVPDLFVVGYGLDYAEHYRNLPFVGVLHPELYGASSPSNGLGGKPWHASAGGAGKARRAAR